MPYVAVSAAYHADFKRPKHSFDRFAGVTIAAGLATFAFAFLTREDAWPSGQPTFWLLAAMCVAGELLPIRLGRKAHCERVTMSSAFALAILLGFGALPAMCVYVLVSVLADAKDRIGVYNAAFNAAQYLVALGAATALLELLAYVPDTVYAPSEAYAYLLSVAAFFVTNHVLAGAAAALLVAHPVRSYVAADLGFHAWTAGLPLTLTPLILVAADTQLLLVALLSLPLLGIYFGGRHAVLNAHLVHEDGLEHAAR